MTNRTMTVYLPNGARYFHTDSIAPAEEAREEDYWVAQGYVVVFTESAAAQTLDATRPADSCILPPVPVIAPVADHSKDA